MIGNILRSRSAQLIALLAAVAIVVTATVMITSGGHSKKITAYFTSAVGLYPGSDVRTLGVRMGTIDAVEPEGERVRVDMTLDPDVHVPAGAAALVVTPSIVADRYVQLTPVWVSGPEIEDGAEIALNKTAVPVELDQLFRSLNDLTTALGPNGANANGALGDLIQAGATNLDGNGEKLNQMLRDLGKATRTLNGSQDDLFTTLESVQRFTTMLAQNDASVGKFNALMVDVTQFFASERDDFGASLHELTDALSQVQDFVKNNRGRLKSNVDKLSGITQVLVNQKNSLDEALSAAPLALGNLVNAYDAGSGTLDGRGNLNEYSFGAPNLPLPSAGGAG